MRFKNVKFINLVLFLKLTFFFNLYALISSSQDYELINSDISNSSSFSTSGDYSSEGSIGLNFAQESAFYSTDYTLRTGFYNPPHFQFQRKLSINYSWGNDVSVSFPANSIDLERFDILWQENTNLNPDIEDATRKLSKIKGVEIIPARSFNLSFFDEQEIKTQVANKGRVSVKVLDSDLDGYVDNSSSKIRFNTLSGYIYDNQYKMWAKAYSSKVSYYGSYAMVDFEAFSGGIFGVMGDVDTSVKDTYAFPVPFRPNGPKAGVCSGCSGTDDEGITFYNVPQRGYIEIYTVDGRLVKKLNIDETTLIETGGIGKIKWDTKNEAGEKVVSGVYIWRVVSESYLPGYKNTKTGKLVIIR